MGIILIVQGQGDHVPRPGEVLNIPGVPIPLGVLEIVIDQESDMGGAALLGRK